MSIAPIILRLYPELDAAQREAVGHAEGPMLVIAGPGSGKTGCIHLRAVNLLLTGRTAPSELVLCTFGRDAAWQLQRRFTSSAMACGVPGNFSQVCITTIHSLCHRLLKPHATLVGLGPGYRVLDEEQQRLLLRQESGAVFGPDWDTLSRRGWRDGVHMALSRRPAFSTASATSSFTPRTWPSRDDPSSPPWAAAACVTGSCCCAATPWISLTFRSGPTG